MRALLLALLLASTALAETVPLYDDGNREYTVRARINGQVVECLLDTGASAPQNAIFLRRDYAASRGFNRQGSDYHYYQGLNVSTGGFARSNVLSYEYTAIDHPCLIGLSFYKGRSVFTIDLNTNRMTVK